MVSCGMELVKFLIFLFNFLFFISAVGIIATGAIVEVENAKYMSFLGSDFASPALMLIVIGVVGAIIAFFGCCGAVKKNYCMMMTYSALLGVILILELAAGISAYVLQKDLRTVVSDNMLKTMAHYDGPEYKKFTHSWHNIQMDLNCCGVYSYKDWATQPAFANTTNLPDSCCKVYGRYCGVSSQGNSSIINTYGCMSKLVDFADKNILTIGGVGIGIAFIQVLGIIFSCCLAKAIKSEYEDIA